ncbi:MAG TPA: YihY/virulence factor BrkB family protein [Terriglobales bacterium]|jgi:membrane protein|nr:YihY/virulence factor BrkB family protein [Terriglobales bacterium]
MTFANVKKAIARARQDALRDQTFQAAAALSYYTIVSVFPGLILLSAVMAYIPLPDFFADVLVAMTRVLPADAVMPTIYSVLIGVLGANLRAWLSFGTLGTLWLVSSAFDEMIDALDAAYNVTDPRPFWRTRLLAFVLAVITGALLMCAVATMVLGPRVGAWLAGRMSMSGVFTFLWPLIHKTLAIAFTVVAVQTVYFLAPNVKQRFRATVPGAILSVACWMGLSSLLGIYFRYFANYNRIYGTLGGVMALMTWLYWAYFIFVVGGQLNAELEKQNRVAPLRPRDTCSIPQSQDRTA